MENERRKQKYLDKLRKTTSERLKNDNGVLKIQNDSSLCFNEKEYVEPILEQNDLLAKVERYIKANPMSHISKDRLTRGLAIKKGSQQRTSLRSNLDIGKISEKTYKSRGVPNLENEISFIKPNQKVVNLNPDTKIKCGPPKATSTIKQQPITQYISISPKQNDKSNIAVNKNNKFSISGKNNFGNECSSSNWPSSSVLQPLSKIVRRNTPGISSTLVDQKFNIKTHISIEDKAKLNLTYCLYLEFVHANCDIIKNMNEKVYPNNEYSSINLKKKLQQIKLKYLNKQKDIETNLTSTFNSDNNDKYNDSFKNGSSESIISFSDFVFKPVMNLESNNSETSRVSLFSKDSFVCLTQETLFTSIDNSLDKMDIDQAMPHLDNESFSSPEIYPVKNKNNKKYKKKVTHFQSKLTYLSNFDSSSD